jgi:hypothetical protein
VVDGRALQFSTRSRGALQRFANPTRVERGVAGSPIPMMAGESGGNGGRRPADGRRRGDRRPPAGRLAALPR